MGGESEEGEGKYRYLSGGGKGRVAQLLWNETQFEKAFRSIVISSINFHGVRSSICRESLSAGRYTEIDYHASYLTETHGLFYFSIRGFRANVP